MARTIEITVDANETDHTIERLLALEGVLGLSVQRGAGIHPPGDVLTVRTTTDAAHVAVDIVSKQGGSWSIVTSRPKSIVSDSAHGPLDVESNEATWEEMALLLRTETNPRGNYLSLMALSGAVAAVGLWTDTLHLVVGAMVMAPGFHPILRIPFGFLTRLRGTGERGVLATVAGYGALAVGSALATLLLLAVTADSPDLASRQWVRYWSIYSSTSMVVAAFAALAGAVTIAADRSVLAAGAMIALALIPGATLVGMGAVAGDWGVAVGGLMRWGIDVAMVGLVGGGVLLVKRVILDRRPAAGP